MLPGYQQPKLPQETLERLDTVMQTIGVDLPEIKNKIAAADQGN